MTLLADVNHPESQEDLVSNWKPAHSLVEDAISGAEIATAPCLPALAVAHPPFCLWEGRAHMAAGLLSFGIPSILCSVVAPEVTVWFGVFCRKGFFFFFFFPLCLSGNATVCVAVSY